jgi:hypothetical protein
MRRIYWLFVTLVVLANILGGPPGLLWSMPMVFCSDGKVTTDA